MKIKTNNPFLPYVEKDVPKAEAERLVKTGKWEYMTKKKKGGK